MGSEKRERKKANRGAKLAAEQAEEARRRRNRFIRNAVIMAVGIIMAQNRCSQLEAFEILKTASSTRNSKLHDVAAAVVNSLGQGPARTHYDG